MSGRFRVGSLRDLYTQPLYRILKSSAAAELFVDTPAAHIDRLMSKEADAAFVAPMDYAVNSSDLVIVPGVGVTASGFSGTVRLYLRDRLEIIKTMAVGPVATTDVVLTRIVLGEKYDSAPAIVPVAGTVDNMLAKADCALVAGDALLTLQSQHPFIDLVDEWSDITDLPFVHSFCVSRSEAMNKDLEDLLITSQQAGRLELQATADDLAGERNLPAESLFRFLSNFSYEFGESAKESLETFMQLAFYHGMLPDVPEINIGS